MPNSLRLSFGALLLAVAAACSRSSEQPAVSGDLEQDLAKAGGANVQLAGSSTNRVDVVSATERLESQVPTPKGESFTPVPTKKRGKSAAVKSRRHETPVAVESPKAAETAPVEQPRMEPQPTPTSAPQGRPQAPMPSTQPEPRGGWRTPGEVIRNAPFPINP
jgi:outer membrane biosynthesis protein TonB